MGTTFTKVGKIKMQKWIVKCNTD